MFAWLGEILYNFFAVMGFLCVFVDLIFLGLLIGTWKREKPGPEAYLPRHDDEYDTQPRHDAVARRLLQDVSLDL